MNKKKRKNVWSKTFYFFTSIAINACAPNPIPQPAIAMALQRSSGSISVFTITKSIDVGIYAPR